jgi:hypothetical protein
MIETELMERIGAADPTAAATVNRDSEATVEPLPFHQRFRLLKVLVPLPHKPLLFRFADDGERVIRLDTPEGLYEVNALEPVQLAEPDVAAYVRSFLANGGFRQYRLVERAEEVPWLPASATVPELAAARAACAPLVHEVRVARTDGGFRAAATVLEQRTLLTLVMEVTPDGRVSFVDRVVLAEGVPVPYVGL